MTAIQVTAEIRRFSRFYTRKLGLLEETLSGSPYTLTEARVLYDLGSAPGASASQIAGDLRLDPAYLTRILRKFDEAGLVSAESDPSDGRRRLLSLTTDGEAAFATLVAAADREMGKLIADLDASQRARLIAAMAEVTALLEHPPAPAPVTLRPHAIGDIGWVIERQARLYAEEYGWDAEYEALVCEIGSAFLKNFIPGKEFCWIAERNGERLGAIFLVRRSDEQAQLRLLHVERTARGAGVGSVLVEQCVRFARDAGYKSMMLWTQDSLTGARRLYERAGFRRISIEQVHKFGQPMGSEIWEMDLLARAHT